MRSSSSKDISLKKVKGENFYRNAKQVARAKMLTGGKAVRDKDGNIIKAAAFQKGESETKPGRVQPDRRWFGAYWGVGMFCDRIPEDGWMKIIRQYESDITNCARSL